MDLNQSISGKQVTESGVGIPSASPLSPIDLNNIKLDPKHTLLTPDYLKSLINEG